MQIYLRALMCFWILILSACGGGGSSPAPSSPVASNETFQLKAAYVNSISTSQSTNFTISGTANGLPVTGSGTAVESTLTNATFEGVNCKTQTVTITGNMSINGISYPYGGTYNEYYDFDNNYIGSSGDEYSVRINSFNMPLTCKVNDTGIIFVEQYFSSSAKTTLLGTYTVSYAVEADTANTAILKIITTEKDTNNNVLSTDITALRMTPAGETTRLYETFVGYGQNIKLTF